MTEGAPGSSAMRSKFESLQRAKAIRRCEIVSADQNNGHSRIVHLGQLAIQQPPPQVTHLIPCRCPKQTGRALHCCAITKGSTPR